MKPTPCFAILTALCLPASACYESTDLDEHGNPKGTDQEDIDTSLDSDTTEASGTEDQEGNDTRRPLDPATDAHPSEPRLDCESINAGLCDTLLCDLQEAWEELMVECGSNAAECTYAADCYEDHTKCFYTACPPGSNMTDENIDDLNECLMSLSDCVEESYPD